MEFYSVTISISQKKEFILTIFLNFIGGFISKGCDNIFYSLGKELILILPEFPPSLESFNQKWLTWKDKG